MIPIVLLVGIGLVLPLTNLASTHSQLKKIVYEQYIIAIPECKPLQKKQASVEINYKSKSM